MVEDLSEFSAGEFQTVSELLASSEDLQALMVVLVLGLCTIAIGYRSFGKWMYSKEFSYTRPHASRFARTAMLAFFAIGLVTAINVYIQVTNAGWHDVPWQEEATQTFAKILNTINILVIGYTVSQLIPIALNMAEKAKEEKEDFEKWKDLKGFKDDEDDLFHKIFKWIPPKIPPEDLTKEEFEKNLQTKEGLNFLENYRTSKGVTIGSYEKQNLKKSIPLMYGEKKKDSGDMTQYFLPQNQQAMQSYRKSVFQNQLSKFFLLEFLLPLLLVWLDGGELIFLFWLQPQGVWHWELD